MHFQIHPGTQSRKKTCQRSIPLANVSRSRKVKVTRTCTPQQENIIWTDLATANRLSTPKCVSNTIKGPPKKFWTTEGWNRPQNHTGQGAHVLSDCVKAKFPHRNAGTLCSNHVTGKKRHSKQTHFKRKQSHNMKLVRLDYTPSDVWAKARRPCPDMGPAAGSLAKAMLSLQGANEQNSALLTWYIHLHTYGPLCAWESRLLTWCFVP